MFTEIRVSDRDFAVRLVGRAACCAIPRTYRQAVCYVGTGKRLGRDKCGNYVARLCSKAL